MRFGSVCSGIEAASVAWNPLGWRAQFVSEIEPFPCAVLAHHYPDVPNCGDMTQFKDWPDATLDVLCGGTPCQSFSVAGLRKGLDDPRGNLMLTFGAIAARYRPKWLVWENVPGVLSSNEGRDFGSFLGLLGVLGYGFAYRVLDAQYFGLAQRRKRVFVVGCLGDWRCAAAVLLERDSLSWHPAPRRRSREDIAGTTDASSGRSRGAVTNPGTVVATLDASYGRLQGASGQDANHGHSHLITHALTGEGFDASEDGTGRGTPLVVADTLRGHERPGSNSLGAVALVTAFDCKASGQSGFGVGDIASTMRAMGHANSHTNGGGHQAVMEGLQVRRLTPRECARLQGFPDDYLDIIVRGKPAADGPKYKALGNSWAVPNVRWIGRRIDQVEQVTGVSFAGGSPATDA